MWHWCISIVIQVNAYAYYVNTLLANTFFKFFSYIDLVNQAKQGKFNSGKVKEF